MNTRNTQMTGTRNYKLEILRIISCFFIVYDHGNGADWPQKIGNLALIVFILISSYFLFPQKDYSAFVSKRVKRLMIPWVFWFTLYGIFRMINHNPFMDINNGDIFSAVLAGSRSHLWYLPFIFIMSITMVFWYNLLINESRISEIIHVVSCVLITVVLLLSTPVWRPWGDTLIAPWGSWLLALPAFFTGAAFSGFNRYMPERRSLMVLYALVIIFISGYMTIAGSDTVRYLSISYVLGLALFAVAAYPGFQFNRFGDVIMKLSGYTFGIYLIHPLVYSVEKKLGYTDPVFLPVITYGISLLMIYVAYRMPFRFIKKII